MFQLLANKISELRLLIFLTFHRRRVPFYLTSMTDSVKSVLLLLYQKDIRQLYYFVSHATIRKKWSSTCCKLTWSRTSVDHTRTTRFSSQSTTKNSVLLPISLIIVLFGGANSHLQQAFLLSLSSFVIGSVFFSYNWSYKI